MIKFIPYHEKNFTVTHAPMLENVPAIAERKLCASMNEKDFKIKCDKPGCQGVDSIVMINGGDAEHPKLTFEIKSYCCEDFKQTLEEFLSLQ